MNTVTPTTRRTVLGAAFAVLPFAALAQQVLPPDRPIRLIVPLATGSTVDAVARALAPAVGRATGHPVVVENVAGAGGILGTAQVVKAPKDGSVLGLISSNHVINPGIYKTIPYDSLKDITPIAVLATVPLVLVVNPALPVKNVRELIAYAKAKPDRLNVGSAGNGSTLHLAAELLKNETGMSFLHVPYRGTGPLITDLMGGQVQAAFVSVSQVAGQIQAGSLRALAVSTRERSKVLPDVPTLVEAGVPNYAFDAWVALIGPAGLPKPVVERYATAFQAALRSPEAQNAVLGQGLAVMDIGPAAAPAFLASELDKHQKLVRLSGARID